MSASTSTSANGTVDQRRGGIWLPLQESSSTSPEDLPQWLANLQIQRLLSIAMFACVAWALVQALTSSGMAFLQALSIGIVATVVYTAGVALGGRSHTRNLRRYSDYGITDWVLLLIPILLVLKLLPYLLQSPAAVGAEVASWMGDPSRFWDMALVWSLILVFFVWDESLRQAEALAQLSLQPGELAPAMNTPEYHEWSNSPYRFVNHEAAWRRLMWRFVGGGFVLLIFTGVAVIRPDQLGNPDRPEAAGFLPHALLYYLFGMILAGQTSLDRLRTAWLRAGANVQHGLARRWLGYGFGVVGVALFLAVLFPTAFSLAAGSNVPVLSLLLLPLRLLFGAFNWLVSHIAAWLLIPLTWLVPSHTGMSSGNAGPERTSIQPTPFPASEPPPADPTLATRVVFAFLLYVLPFGLALYALWNTWRKRHAIWFGLRTFWRDVWLLLRGGLLDLLAVLWRLFSFGSPRLLSFAPSAIQERLRRRRARGAGAGEGVPGWLRLRGLGARALIQYFYVSLAQRAAAIGWERQPGQTAYEYSRDLAARMPNRQEEIDTLTEAFVRAKYSPHPVSAEDAKRARTPWERIRGVLQTRRRTHQLGSWLGLNRES